MISSSIDPELYDLELHIIVPDLYGDGIDPKLYGIESHISGTI
jgi:regulator of RNase E activity RraB